jgi:RimJ/RimL family protein N-acetyltransferase
MQLQDDDVRKGVREPDQVWVQPIVIEGHVVRLEPLTVNHSKDLAKACDPEMFRYFPVFPMTFDRDGLEDYIRGRTNTPLTVAYAIVQKKTGKAIGSSSFFDIRPGDKGLEVGHTWIKKEHRSTQVNPETKLLMLGHAFETLGAIRVQLKTDARNVQSRSAMKKLGAKEEGTLRHNMVMPDGFVRDSVYFSILAEEWPEVKSGLLVRLKP